MRPGLSAATVSTIVKELLAAGVVDTRNTTRSGRRAQMVTIARRVGLAVGVAHRAAGTCGSRSATSSHEVVAEQTLPLPHEHRVDTTPGPRGAAGRRTCSNASGRRSRRSSGIGVGLPAPVDTATGMVSVRGIMRGWDEVHVGHVLSKRLARPVLRRQRRQPRGARGEHARRVARSSGTRSTSGRRYGTGAGIVLGGHVHRGFAGTAGEIGHVQVDPQGDICRCGSRGCLDTVVGAAALLEPLRASHGTLALRDVIQRAIDGDPGCARVVADAGSTIGEVVSGLAMAVNPQCIVVGGELAETGERAAGTAA